MNFKKLTKVALCLSTLATGLLAANNAQAVEIVSLKDADGNVVSQLSSTLLVRYYSIREAEKTKKDGRLTAYGVKNTQRVRTYAKLAFSGKIDENNSLSAFVIAQGNNYFRSGKNVTYKYDEKGVRSVGEYKYKDFSSQAKSSRFAVTHYGVSYSNTDFGKVFYGQYDNTLGSNSAMGAVTAILVLEDSTTVSGAGRRTLTYTAPSKHLPEGLGFEFSLNNESAKSNTYSSTLSYKVKDVGTFALVGGRTGSENAKEFKRTVGKYVEANFAKNVAGVNLVAAVGYGTSEARAYKTKTYTNNKGLAAQLHASYAVEAVPNLNVYGTLGYYQNKTSENGVSTGEKLKQYGLVGGVSYSHKLERFTVRYVLEALVSRDSVVKKVAEKKETAGNDASASSSAAPAAGAATASKTEEKSSLKKSSVVHREVGFFVQVAF